MVACICIFQQLLTEDGFKSTGPLTFWGKAAVKLSEINKKCNGDSLEDIAAKSRRVGTGMTLIFKQLT